MILGCLTVMVLMKMITHLIFLSMGIGRDNLINSDDPEVEDLILKVDEGIYQTNKLLEKHILENFFMIDDFDMEKEEDWIEYRGKCSELKSELFQKFHNVKNSFLELDKKFPTQDKFDLTLQY